MKAPKKNSLYLALAIIGFLLNLSTYAPGFMSGDSVDQLGQSISGQYSAWHPPIMAYWWHILGWLHEGPQPMLVFQLLLLWLSYCTLATINDSKKWQLGLFAMFMLAPVIQNFSGYIIKDTQMGLSWLLSLSIIIKYAVSGRKMPIGTIIFTALLLAYGTWVRHNALSGLLMLCLAWAWVVFTQRTRVVRIAAAVGLFLLVIVAQKVLTAAIKPSSAYPETILYMHDLSALYVKTGDATIFPNEVYNDPEFDTAYIRTKFHPAIYDHIVWNPENKHIVKFDEERNKVLKPAWLAAIKKYPGTYLANRWETFLYFLRIRNYSGITYYNPWIADNEFGYSINGNRPSYKLYTKLMDKQKNAFYFNIWFWGLVNIILFAGVRMIRDSAHKFIYTCILLSGILYLLPYYLLITVDTDFRYVYWMCLCCIMAIIYLLLIRRQQQLLNNNTISTQQPGKPHG